VLITGITAFMLNPDGWSGSWAPERGFWAGFFNFQFVPQTIARTGGALLLSSLYVYLHASLVAGDGRLRDLVGLRSARPALLGAVLVTLGGLGWYAFLPESAKAVLEGAAVLNVLMALILALTAAVFVLLYLGPYRNPGWLSPGFAAALFLFGLAAFTTGEFIREAVRKPYVVYNVVLGNQILPSEVPAFRKAGYLEAGTWTRVFVAARYPQVISGDPARPATRRIDPQRLLDLPPRDRIALGRVLFQYHCNDCHAVRPGYSAVGPLVRGRPRESVRSLIEHLERAHLSMPPWAGTTQEAELLTDYLVSIAPPRPSGMLLGPRATEVD
jgi:cytochrome d ubiquinol oxidase subunit I